MSSSNFNWKKYIDACLESTTYCSIATFDGKKIWSNPVYFAYDKDYNFYFYSMPNSRHMKNLKKDTQIAVSIYNTHQDTHGDVSGIQLEGKALWLLDTEVSEAMKIYYGRVYGKKTYDIPKEKHIGEKAPWKFVKIIPKTIYYFDTKYFKENRQKVPFDAIR